MKLDKYDDNIKVEDQRGWSQNKKRILSVMSDREAHARAMREEAFNRARQERDDRSNQRSQGKRP